MFLAHALTPLLYRCSYAVKSHPSVELKHHKQSCRVVKFSDDGTSELSGGRKFNLKIPGISYIIS